MFYLTVRIWILELSLWYPYRPSIHDTRKAPWEKKKNPFCECLNKNWEEMLNVLRFCILKNKLQQQESIIMSNPERADICVALLWDWTWGHAFSLKELFVCAAMVDLSGIHIMACCPVTAHFLLQYIVLKTQSFCPSLEHQIHRLDQHNFSLPQSLGMSR